MIRFINIRHLAGDRDLFTGLNWHVRPGDRVGLVGDNGTGKTTLLRMAAGEVEPTSGDVILRRHTRIGYLRQEIHASSGDTTVLQETMKAFEAEQEAHARVHQLYEQLAAQPDAHESLMDEIHMLERRVRHHDAGSAESDARKILSGLGFSVPEMDAPLATFSGGWQMRAQIARLLLENPDLLMLDEPTNHLDLESINWLEQFLASFPGALIVVSHDRYFLDRITTRTAWLAMRTLRSYAGSYSQFLVQRDQEEDLLRRRYENQQEEIAHIQRFIDRFRYKATKAAAVQSRVKMLERMERIELPASARRVRLRIPEPAPAGQQVLELRDMGKSYDDNLVFRGVNLPVERGDKVALVGPNGAGKSTLLKICAGVLRHDGERILHPKVQLEYFSQHRIDMLDPDSDVLNEARPAGAAQTDEEIRAILGAFLFTGDDVFKPVRVLSGGEKSRLALARMMMRRGNLLLLDEPTNHLDINTREVLQRALSEFPGTIIMISHDRWFIDAIATKIAEVGNGTVRLHFGNYTDLMRKREQLADGATAEPEASLRGRAATSVGNGALAAIELAKADKREARRAQAEERRERAERRNAMKAKVRELEAQIEAHETRLAELHALMSDPASYADGRMTPEMAAEARTIERELPRLIDAWETLSEEYAQFIG